ncbi:MAG: hypothetical protein M3413_03390 [Bacteroidota bacterium]|nr:hypothetical protein [Bacteroidota bacterium]
MAFKNFKAIILLPLFFLHCAPYNKTSYQLSEVTFTATGKKEALLKLGQTYFPFLNLLVNWNFTHSG